MQKVFEIQSNWDQRKQMRLFALTPPVVVPPMAPQYLPPYMKRRDMSSNNDQDDQRDHTGPTDARIKGLRGPGGYQVNLNYYKINILL
jgi:hypothetical protein